MRKIFSKIDKPLFFSMIFLCVIGLIMVFSSSSESAILRYNKPSTYFFFRQLIFLGIAFFFGIITLKIPTKLYKGVSWLLILGIIGVLVLLLLYGGITNHAQSWFNIPGTGFALQPSEFAKSFLIIYMACFYNTILKNKNDNIIVYLIPLFITLIIVILILMQPDFGSAAILLAIAICIFLSLPVIKKNIFKLSMIVISGVVVLVLALLYSGAEILSSEQMSRFNFRNPCQRYKEKTGYQVCNGFIAINNGGLTGVGIGKSTQKHLYLPESHTDFIFAILVEEWGLLFSIVIVMIYVLILYRILKIARESYNIRNSILAYGTFWLFSLHILVNLCGLLALLPLTGVPLPLMSYGGSSTLNFVIMLFITQRVAIENSETKYNLELKKITQ